MTHYAKPIEDGSRRHRYSGGGALVHVPRQQEQLPTVVEAAATHPTALLAAPAPNALSKPVPHVADPNGDNWSNIARDLAPSLAAVLRPAGASRWMLPSVSAITPQYIEATLRGALAGNHVQAWELFDLMIDTDPEIAACTMEYVDGVKEKRLVVTPYTQGGNEPTPTALRKAAVVEACLRNMRPDMANDENDFSAMARDVLYARFHGQSVLEIDWYTKDGKGLNMKDFGDIGQVVVPRTTFWVHPVCYAWDMNGRLGLRMALESQLKDAVALNPKASGSVFKTIGNDLVRSMVEPPAWAWITSQARPSMLMDFPPNKFLIGIDKFKAGTVMGSGSELRTLAFWWIASMFCGDWLLNYAQLFGIPFRTAKYAPNTTEQVKQELRQMMESMGAQGYALIQNTCDIIFDKAMGGTADSPQAFLFKFANEMKRKVILRQTMSGGSGSQGTGVGKGGMETEAMGPKDQCVNAGAQFFASVLNLQFVPYILNVNFGDGGDLEAPTCEMVDEEVGTVADANKLQIVSGFLDVGEDYARRLFKIPRAAPGEKILGKDTGSAALKAQSQQGGFGGGYQDEEQQPDESDQQYQARKAYNNLQRQLQASSAKVPQLISAAAPAVTDALAQTVSPLLKRMQAISEIADKEVKKDALAKLLKDWPKITKALQHDPSLAEAVAGAVTGGVS